MEVVIGGHAGQSQGFFGPSSWKGLYTGNNAKLSMQLVGYTPWCSMDAAAVYVV